MAYYRVVIPHASPAANQTGRPLRFAAGLECGSASEARQRGVSELRELALDIGLNHTQNPATDGVFIEETENRTGGVLEMVELEYEPGKYGMKLQGPLESATALQLDKEIYGLQQQGAKSLVIDLGSVHPLGSAGLGVLLNLNDRLTVRLVRVPIKARNMMQMLGLDANLQIFDSFPEAIENI